MTEIIRKMLDVLPDNLIGLRDKTLILIGYAGAFRRSELVSLNVEDLDFQKEGLIINLRPSSLPRVFSRYWFSKLVWGFSEFRGNSSLAG